jgi:hypothetical protein
MRLLFCMLASALGLFAAVDGVVMNATTGQPQPSVVVSLVQPGANGMQTLASVKSGPDGKFTIDKDFPAGPALLQGLHQGATYNLMLTPGAPTTGLRLNVFDSTSQPAAAKVEQHMVLLEPTAAALNVGETLLCKNDTNTTFQDASKGSVQFYLPAAAAGKVQVTINAPGGMPIQRPAEKTSQPNIYKVNYPLKPGETRFDIAYSLPASDTFAAKNLTPGSPTRLVTPSTVTVSGESVKLLGQEPQTKAHIYDILKPAYEVKIEGTGSLRNPEAAPAAGEEDNGAPQVEQQPARIYSRLGWVLGLALGILALGGTMLYRKGTA